MIRNLPKVFWGLIALTIIFSGTMVSAKPEEGKSPSGWLQGKKVGWGNSETPPGLSEKELKQKEKEAKKQQKQAEKEARQRQKQAEKEAKKKQKEAEKIAKAEAERAQQEAAKAVAQVS